MTEPRKIAPDVLKQVFARLRSGDEAAVGTWLYKGFRVQVSRFRSTGTERSALLYRRRREKGLCVRCGARVTKRNPRTGSLYRLCDDHREEIDQA